MNHCVRCKLQNPLKSLKLKIATLLQGGVHALIGRSIVLDLKIPASLENALAG